AAGWACSGHGGAGARYRPEACVLPAACVDFSGRESVVLSVSGSADEYIDERPIPVWRARCGRGGRGLIIIGAGVVAVAPRIRAAATFGLNQKGAGSTKARRAPLEGWLKSSSRACSIRRGFSLALSGA